VFESYRRVTRSRGNADSTAVTSGTPVWLQDSRWPKALRGFLGQWLGSTPTRTCGTDDASQQRYRDTMTEAGLDVTETSYAYTDEFDLDHLIGSLYSALPARKLPRRTSGQTSPT
jgi:hypothetical protein